MNITFYKSKRKVIYQALRFELGKDKNNFDKKKFDRLISSHKNCCAKIKLLKEKKKEKK